MPSSERLRKRRLTPTPTGIECRCRLTSCALTGGRGVPRETTPCSCFNGGRFSFSLRGRLEETAGEPQVDLFDVDNDAADQLVIRSASGTRRLSGATLVGQAVVRRRALPTASSERVVTGLSVADVSRTSVLSAITDNFTLNGPRFRAGPHAVGLPTLLATCTPHNASWIDLARLSMS